MSELEKELTFIKEIERDNPSILTHIDRFGEIKIKDEQKLCYILEHLKLFDENLLDTKEVPSIEDYKNYKAVNNAH